MKYSFKLLLAAVVAVVFLLATQNSAFANEKKGKFVSFKDKNGSYFKFYNQSNNNSKVVWQENLSNPKKPFKVNNRPTRKNIVYPIASSKNNNFIEIYLGKLKRTLRAYKY